MSDNNKDSLFEADDKGQQILPFDFPEDDEIIEDAVGGAIPSEAKRREELHKDSEPVALKQETATEVASSEKKDEKPENPPQESSSTSLTTEKTEVQDAKRAAFAPVPDDLSAAVKRTVSSKKYAPIKNATTSVVPSSSKPTVRKLPSAKKKGVVRKNPLKKSDGAFPPSQILREARVRTNLSHEQVSQITKIKESFIDALEQGDEGGFPPQVFVVAYAKQLCKLYKIDPAPVIQGFERTLNPNGDAHKVSNEILNDIDSGKQVNVREEERLKRILKIAVIIIVVMVALLFFGGIFFSGSDTPKNEIADSGNSANSGVSDIQTPTTNSESPRSLTPSEIEVFMIDQPAFTMTKLKVKKNDELHK